MASEKKIISYAQAGVIARKLHKQKKKIVFVVGSYDLPHGGHAYFFERAKEQGDVLFVSVGSNENIKALKGVHRPILDQKLRARGVAAFGAVDYVVIDNEKLFMPGKINFAKLIALIRPDVFAVNNTDSAINEKRSFVRQFGSKLVLINVKKGPDISTTKIIDEVIKRHRAA